MSAEAVQLHAGCWQRGDGDRVTLIASRCTHCGTRYLPPTSTCVQCRAQEFDSEPLSAVGSLYAYTVIRGAGGVWPDEYAVAYVDYPEGVRVFGHLKLPDGQLPLGTTVRTEEAIVYTQRDGIPVHCFRFVVAQ